MSEVTEFLHHAEEELVSTESISSATCGAFAQLSPNIRGALQRAMAFVGCDTYQGNNGQDVVRDGADAVRDDDRIAAARLMLIKLKVHSAEPVWSSEVLRRFVDAVITAPGGKIGELFSALFALLADYPSELSVARASFIKDLVVACFTRHKADYEAFDWECFANKFRTGATTSQLYFALLAIDPEQVSEELATAIAHGLEHTPYRDEALRLLVA